MAVVSKLFGCDPPDPLALGAQLELMSFTVELPDFPVEDDPLRYVIWRAIFRLAKRRRGMERVTELVSALQRPGGKPKISSTTVEVFLWLMRDEIERLPPELRSVVVRNRQAIFGG